MKIQNLQKDDFYLLAGPAELTVRSGSLEAIAARLGTGEKVVVPLGKSLPIKTLETSSVEFEAKDDAFTKMEASSIPSEWDDLPEKIAKERVAGQLYKVIVMGEVDTGKTFFSTYLANRLIAKLGRTAILDCDTGQSDIGPTGTFGMLVMKKSAVFLTEEIPTHLYFVGAHSPGLHFLPVMTGLATMLRIAEKEADALIIDTTGWVQGDGGRAIKKAKLDIVNPDLVVLMQRGTELEHLVKHLPPSRIARLPVSKKASLTSQLDRKALREMVSTRYFRDSHVVTIPFRQVFTDRSFFLTGSPLSLPGTLHSEKLSGFEGVFVVTSGPPLPEMTKEWPKDVAIRNFIAGDERGLLIALLSGAQDCLALGRLEEIDFLNNQFRIRTPYKASLEKVAGIQFGSLRVNEKGEEAGFLEPGSL